MENILAFLSGVVCPVCKSACEVAEYPSKRGFRLLCEGPIGRRHRIRIYAEFPKDDSAVMPEPVAAVVVEMPRKSRVKELLERAARLREAA